MTDRWELSFTRWRFGTEDKEEDELTRYIRQHERELHLKGLSV